MKVLYDPATDSLTVVFRDARIKVSDDRRPGVILDFDRSGNLVSLEILDASRRMPDPKSVTLSVLEHVTNGHAVKRTPIRPKRNRRRR